MASAALPAASSSTAALSQEEANRLFARRSFLIIDDPPLPYGSTFGVDGVEFVTNDRFRGIKLLPGGWHLFVWSATAPHARPGEGGNDEDAGMAMADVVWPLRSAMLHHFDEGEDDKDVLLRSWVLETDELVLRGTSPDAQSSRTSRQWPAPSQRAPKTIADMEKLKAMDSQLGAWPLDADAAKRWRAATANMHAHPDVVARVVGYDESSGDMVLDGASAVARGDTQQAQEGPRMDGMSKSERELERALREGASKVVWGKARQMDTEADDRHASGEAAATAQREREDMNKSHAERKAKTLDFTSVDLKRSWPEGSTGSEVTRWSIDKSMALRKAVKEAGGPAQLVAEMELAFVLFLYVHNSSCQTAWQTLVSLVCRSVAYIGSPSTFDPHPAESHSSLEAIAGTQGAPVDTTLHALFLRALKAQMELLRPEIVSQELPELGPWLEGELMVLRSGMARAMARASVVEREKQGGEKGAGSKRGLPRDGVDSEDDDGPTVVRRSAPARRTGGLGTPATSARSAKTVPSAANSQPAPNYEELLSAWRGLSHTLSSRFDIRLDERLDEEREVELDEEAEEGEDAPVVVEL